MKRRIEAAAAVLAGVIALGCEQPPPSAPTLTAPLFAAATTMDLTATATLTITDQGNQWCPAASSTFAIRPSRDP